MRIAALYDIHGNLPALDAVLQEVRAADADFIVIGGDVLPGPMPRESLERLQTLDIPLRFISGNGDRMVRELMTGAGAPPPQARAWVEWTAQQLSSEHAEVLASWPATQRIRVDGVGNVLFCHATPRNDSEIFTRLTPEQQLLPVFAEVNADVVVCGHTHMQFDRMVGKTRVVNAGSVGMPFGEPGAYYLLLGPGVELRRTSYDIPGTAERIAASTFPGAQEFAANYILRPPAEMMMLETYGRAEVK
jgi:putative phosphoesterase